MELFVPCSLEARQGLDHLDVLERRGAWGEAAEACDELVARFGDELVQVDARHYRNVSLHVRDRILGWPSEGLRRYRELMEPRARRELPLARQAATAAPVGALARRFWPTSAGGEAACQAAARSQADARPETGAAWLLELIGAHPDLHADRHVIEAAAGARRQGAQRYALGGAWPMQGGTPARSAVPDALVPGERLWTANLGRDEPSQEIDTPTMRSDQAGEVPQAVVSGETVYVQSGPTLLALDLYSGRRRWSFDAADDVRALPVEADRLRGPRAPVVSDGRVYAHLCWQTGQRPGSQRVLLVCVDSESGRMFWQAEAAPLDFSGAFRPALLFDGSPLVYEARVYCVARRIRELGFEECWLYGFEADGREVFKTLVAAGPIERLRPGTITRSDPAGYGGTVFVQTNLGAIAGVDGTTGDVRWLTVDAQPVARGVVGSPPLAGRSPVAVLDVGQPATRTIFSIPVLSGSLVLFEPTGGHEIGRFSRELLENAAEAIQRRGRSALGDEQFTELSKIAGSSLHRWLPLNPPEGLQAVGAPLVTRGFIMVPCTSGLACIVQAGGRVEVIPWDALDLPAPADDVELTAAAGLVLVGRTGRLDCLCVKNQGLSLLTVRARANPADPAPWLDLARLAFARPGEQRTGLGALDAAIAALDAPPAVTRPAGPSPMAALRRQGVSLTTGAAVAAVQRRGAEAAPLVADLLQRAERLADAPEAQVRSRFEFAALYERLHRADEAMRLYQEVLSQRELRVVRFPRFGASPAPPAMPAGRPHPATTNGLQWKPAWSASAGRLAESEIDRLTAAHGRELYAEIEARALSERSRLAPNDAKSWRDWIERFPNSNAVIAEGLASYLRLESAAGRVGSGVALVEDMLRRRLAPGDVRAAPLIVEIARAYLGMGERLDGQSWLARGQREFPSYSWQQENREVNWADWRAEPTGSSEPLRSRQPRLACPLVPVHASTQPASLLLVCQEAADRDSSMAMLFSRGVVRGLRMADGAMMWEARPVTVGVPAFLAERGDLLIMRTSYQLVALNRGDGSIAWSVGEPPDLAQSPSMDPEFLTRIDTVVLGRSLAVIGLTDGRAVAVELATGQMLWECCSAGGSARVVAMNESWVVLTAQPAGRNAELVVLGSPDGQVLRRIELDSPTPAAVVRWTPEHTVLVLGSEWLGCYDPITGRELWGLRGQRVRTASLAQGPTGFCLADDLRLYRRRYADGSIAWVYPLEDLDGGAVHACWWDGADVYILTEGKVARFDAADGRVGWAQALPAEYASCGYWLAQRHFLAVSLKSPLGGAGSLAVWWYERGSGRMQTQSLPSPEPDSGRIDVALGEGTLLLWSGSRLAGWSPEEAPARTGGVEVLDP